jgi:hypothetical protein
MTLKRDLVLRAAVHRMGVDDFGLLFQVERFLLLDQQRTLLVQLEVLLVLAQQTLRVGVSHEFVGASGLSRWFVAGFESEAMQVARIWPLASFALKIDENTNNKTYAFSFSVDSMNLDGFSLMLILTVLSYLFYIDWLSLFSFLIFEPGVANLLFGSVRLNSIEFLLKSTCFLLSLDDSVLPNACWYMLE